MTPLIFFGSSPFSVPVLDQLINAKCQITCVVTTPDKPVGRGLKLTPNGVKLLSLKHNIKVFESLSDLTVQLENLPTDQLPIGLVAAYGKIIPESILSKFNGQLYNIHPSLLPKYRGASPLQFQLLDGITETGVTIIQLDSQMDHGPIVAVEKDVILREDTWLTLGERLFNKGTKLFLNSPLLKQESDLGVRYVPQTEVGVSYTKKLTRESGFIPYEEFQNQINNGKTEELEKKLKAFSGWPGVWSIDPNGKRVKLVSINPIKITLSS